MSISFSHGDISPQYDFDQLPIRFTDRPSQGLIDNFVKTLNANGHLPYRVDRSQLNDVELLLIAYLEDGQIVAGCSIKNIQNGLAEIGYMLVHEHFRQLGIAAYMTRLRIEYAQRQGVKMLYAKVRGSNSNSMNNLLRAGFKFAGNYFSLNDDNSTYSWFCLPLQRMSPKGSIASLNNNLIHLIPVIG